MGMDPGASADFAGYLDLRLKMSAGAGAGIGGGAPGANPLAGVAALPENLAETLHAGNSTGSTVPFSRELPAFGVSASSTQLAAAAFAAAAAAAVGGPPHPAGGSLDCFLIGCSNEKNTNVRLSCICLHDFFLYCLICLSIFTLLIPPLSISK